MELRRPIGYGELSGGERLRATLACVLMAKQPPRLIILDEPTNHLDLDSIAAVAVALPAYDGAVPAVSTMRILWTRSAWAGDWSSTRQ